MRQSPVRMLIIERDRPTDPGYHVKEHGREVIRPERSGE